MKDIVVCGGGVAGLITAWTLSEKRKNVRITLIEKDKNLGGLLKSFTYSDFGVFDYGIHTIYDTGVKELDQMIFDLFPPEEWIVNSGYKRDFGGTFFNQQLQSNSAYIDFRNFPKLELQSFREDFYANFKNRVETMPVSTSAHALSLYKYGPKITNSVIAPVIQKVFNKDARTMDPFVMRLLQLERIILSGPEGMQLLEQSLGLRADLGFYDQLNYPAEYLPNKKSLYPAKYGMFRFVQALAKKLAASGVELITGTSINEIVVKENAVTALKFVDSHGSAKTIGNIELVVWTAPLPLLAGIMNFRSLKAFEGGYSTAICNIALRAAPKVKNLFFIYVYDPGFFSHRLSCPTSFCCESYQDGIFRLGVEIILDQKRATEVTEGRIVEELARLGVIDPSDVLFSQLERPAGGYFCPSINNMEAVHCMRDFITSRQLTNLELGGIMSKADLFFQTDVVRDVFLRFS